MRAGKAALGTGDTVYPEGGMVCSLGPSVENPSPSLSQMALCVLEFKLEELDPSLATFHEAY